MKFIQPIAVTTAMLNASTAPENDYAAWSSGTTYAAADRAINTTTHRVYESVQGSNTNHDPTTDDGTWWVDIGPTNRWAMFDQSVGSLTTLASPLTVTIVPGQVIDALALLDLDAASVHVTATDGAAGPGIYDQTFTVNSSEAIDDWFEYFFAGFDSQPTLIIDDLPAYRSIYLTVAMTGTTVECGTLAIGNMRDLGGTRPGAQIGITDYSRKTTDDYGVTTVTQRSYAKRMDIASIISNDDLDDIAVALAAVRATPCVWIASTIWSSLIIYGWAKDWGIAVSYAEYSDVRVTIEGLT